jgi:hypothetical protein
MAENAYELDIRQEKTRVLSVFGQMLNHAAKKTDGVHLKFTKDI